MDEIDERIDRFGYRNRGRDCLDDYQDEYLNVEDLLDDSSDCRQKNYENFTECFEETEFNSENSERENVFNSKDILVFVAFILMLRLSRTQVKMTIAIVEYFLKSSLPFTAKEVFYEINRRHMSHAPKTRLFCPKCLCFIPKGQSCSKESCENFKTPIKRAKNIDPIAITTFEIHRQMVSVISTHFEEIIKFHEQIHMNNVVNKGKNFRESPRYRQLLETEEEFYNHCVNIQISVFFDGFRLKKQTRREYTPFYIRVESLENSIKSLPECVLLLAMIESRGNVPTQCFEYVSQNLLLQLDLLSDTVLDFEGDPWTVRIRLSHGMSDLKGIHEASGGLPYWFSEFGCHKCVVASVSRSRSARSFTGTGVPRTTETMIQQFHSKSFDFGKETGFNAVVLPCNYNLDLLHLLSEGVLKDWTKGLLFSSSSWVERNTTPATMRSLSKILAEVQNYTYSNSFIMSSKDFSRLTGSEIEAVAYVVLRIAVALHVFTDESIHVLLLGNVLICDSLYKKKYAEMRNVANIVGDFHDKSHPLYVTLKTHLTYRHLANDLMINNVDGTNSADFEKLHKYLQLGLVDHNCAHQSIEMSKNFLTIREILSSLKSNVSTNGFVSELVSLKNGVPRFSKTFPITETMKVCSKWEWPAAEVRIRKPEWKEFIKDSTSI
ncbi:hypothetical protein B9Z55_021382 [Caenorhabditis nigoni]|nr:hypothetical protein B9Z55_029020 [Caenorhabditis nigoni]PIC16134.1 hypothetical protein B9Z55_022843 [Caenorhabditis nigoni]PIC22498.1 hypothetical protein B9Z55_016529 [Caenorhabditis nigoni]PIC24470.1 hypothetical protein B9Z55_017801 [Caenorhabditis nigoni]PIC29988.1 hypothetical protein B9Z55_021382 [Caenorhabditis nigoni]